MAVVRVAVLRKLAYSDDDDCDVVHAHAYAAELAEGPHDVLDDAAGGG